MIGRLRGTLVVKNPPQLLLDVGGVGYELEATMTTCCQLPAQGETVELYTHLIVREDAHLLYAFMTLRERDLFRQLIKINGVGAKLALTLLSGMSPAELAACVAAKDYRRLMCLPGIGKKTAERLLVELADKLDGLDKPEQHEEVRDAESPEASTPSPAMVLEEATHALVALGYKPQEASRMVRQVGASDLPREEIIRRALQGAMR